MTTETTPTPVPDSPPVAPRNRLSALSRVMLLLTMVLALVALAGSVLAWRTAQQLQQQVARQVADMGLQSRDSSALARLASEQSKESGARVALLQVKVSELEAQRAQIDSVLQGLAHAKDENLLVDIDAAVQLGLQQSQLTGSAQPMLAALLSADKRLQSASQPQLVALQLAIERDIDAIRKANVSDVPVLAGRIDGVLRMVDTLPLQSEWVQPVSASVQAGRAPAGQNADNWWQRTWNQVRDTAAGLVRVRTIHSRDAALLAPEQGYFLREGLRLRLLNARMALLARQVELARSDVQDVQQQLARYFRTSSPLLVSARQQLDEVLKNIHSTELPAITNTLDALSRAQSAAAASAGAAPVAARPQTAASKAQPAASGIRS